MATILPPPSKRQRTEAAERSRAQQDIEEVPSDAGSLRLQFFDETTGLPIGQGPVLVPVADATPNNLELLLNTLQGHVIFSLAISRGVSETDYLSGLFGIYPISIYASSPNQNKLGSDHDCVSHKRMEGSDKSWSDQHGRGPEYICSTSGCI